MQKQTFEELVERIVAEDPRFRPEAYGFLREALEFTQQSLSAGAPEVERHVSGQQLLEGIRDYALRQYGPMAIDMLAEWGIRRGEDFGEIVFVLIEHRVLRKTDSDSLEDFKGGYDFESALRHPFLPPSRLRSLHPETPPPQTRKA